jgi:hypothetical protein
MKGFRLFVAAALVFSGFSAQADPLVRLSFAEPLADPADSEMPAVGAYAYPDFPPYPPGFSSYRGMGFMGTCCEQISPCALHAWAGYCDEKTCCEPTLGAQLWGQIHGRLPRPMAAGGSHPCKACAVGPGVKGWPVQPSCVVPLGVKFPRLRAQGCGLFGGGRAGVVCESPSGKVSEPTEAETDSDELVPAPPVPEDPEPQTTSVIVPSLPHPASMDRSAYRADLRRLPGVESTH